jgi:hypothetical protein
MENLQSPDLNFKYLYHIEPAFNGVCVGGGQQSVLSGSITDRLYCIINSSVLLTVKKSLTLNLPNTTIVAQPFNVIKWQLKFNPVA